MFVWEHFPRAVGSDWEVLALGSEPSAPGKGTPPGTLSSPRTQLLLFSYKYLLADITDGSQVSQGLFPPQKHLAKSFMYNVSTSPRDPRA